MGGMRVSVCVKERAMVLVGFGGQGEKVFTGLVT